MSQFIEYSQELYGNRDNEALIVVNNRVVQQVVMSLPIHTKAATEVWVTNRQTHVEPCALINVRCTLKVCNIIMGYEMGGCTMSVSLVLKSLQLAVTNSQVSCILIIGQCTN